jgi:hypothetical protein
MRLPTFAITSGLTLAFLAASMPAQAQTLFSTGVDSSGNQLALGADDPHYTSQTTGNPAQVINLLSRPANPQLYTLQSPTSRWIWDFSNAEGTLPGVHSFTTTFTLTAGQVSSSFITGKFAADNAALVYLNNTLIGATSNGPNGNQGFMAFVNFSTSSGLLTGLNTLRFEVTDFGAFAGLNVDKVSVVAASAAPEPGSLALLSLGVLGGLGVLRRRRGR